MTTESPERSADLADLLARTALADQTAFAELYRRTSPHLYAVAVRILREPAAAEEVLQEAFVSIWRLGWGPQQAGPRGGGAAGPLPGVRRVVDPSRALARTCFGRLRRRARTGVDPPGAPGRAGSPLVGLDPRDGAVPNPLGRTGGCRSPGGARHGGELGTSRRFADRQADRPVLYSGGIQNLY